MARKVINVVTGGVTIEYYDISTFSENLQTALTVFSVIAKAVVDNNYMIMTPISLILTDKKVSYIGIGINRNQIIIDNNEKVTIGELIEASGLSSYFSDDNKISEEQFYNLTQPTE